MRELLSEFLNSPAGQGLAAMLAVAFLDFVTGAFAALRDGTFALDAVAAFLRKHVWGRVAPIGTLLVVGYFGGDSSIGTLFLAGAVAAAAAYVAETAASVWGNVSPPKPSAVAELTPEENVNPIPAD
jgi:hypothetical protein